VRGSGEASEESLLIPSVENLVVVLFNMMMRWDFSMRHSSLFASGLGGISGLKHQTPPHIYHFVASPHGS
jgi:hypothetical protein